MKKPVIIVGGGGHAKVLVHTLKLNQFNIIGGVDPHLEQGMDGIPLLGDDSAVFHYSPDHILLVNGIGSVSSLALRKEIFTRFKRKGFSFARLVHPSAIIAEDVQLEEGVQVMAGAIIQPGSVIGCNTIINTRATVDHDCTIGAHVHIAPGSTLSGQVVVEDEVHVGTGATVIQGIQLGQQSVVGAGAVVIRHVRQKSKVIGVPAKEMGK